MDTSNKYIQLVNRALYPPCPIETLLPYAPAELWARDAEAACKEAIKSCPVIDWRAYMAHNPDVSDAGVDAKEHFIRHGIFEQRKLHINRTRLHNSGQACQPIYALTIVLASEILDEAVQATLASILESAPVATTEILLFLRNKDLGAQIFAEKMAQSSVHFKCIFVAPGEDFAKYKRVAANIAEGEYLFFILPGDRLNTNDFKTLLPVLDYGYDIISFAATAELTSCLENNDYKEFNNIADSKLHQVFIGKSIVNSFMIFKHISTFFNAKFYKTSLLYNSFYNNRTYFAPIFQFDYDLLIIMQNASSLITVPDKVYIRRFAEYKVHETKCENILAKGKNAKSIESFLAEEGGLIGYSSLSKNALRFQIEYLVDEIEDNRVTSYINELIDQHGAYEFLDSLVSLYLTKWSKVAEKFCVYETTYARKEIKHLCVIFPGIGNGGADTILVQFCNVLISKGFKISLVLSRSTPQLQKLDGNIKLHFVSSANNNAASMSQHTTQLYEIINQIKPDALAIHTFTGQAVLWETIVAHILNIPVLVFQHVAYYHRLLSKPDPFNLEQILSVFRCADKVLCLSRNDELFYRHFGIDAIRIFNPVRVSDVSGVEFSKRKNKIIFVGRLSDPLKRIDHALAILKEITKINPAMTMIFVGNFGVKKYEDEFYKKARSLNLMGNIEITGWIKNPGIFADQAAIILSTSYTESFSLSLAEAQAHGLPAIAYHLDLTIAEDNESIIFVEQGDILGAAREIALLLDDEPRWRKLSLIARNKMKLFSQSEYLKIFDHIIDTFNSYSEIEYYTEEDYARVMRQLAFYAGQLPPE